MSINTEVFLSLCWLSRLKSECLNATENSIRGGRQQIEIQFCIQRWGHICKSKCYLHTRDEVNTGWKYKCQETKSKLSLQFQKKRKEEIGFQIILKLV